MKSLSAAALAGAPTEALEHAANIVRKNPQALFTDFQWFLYKAQNTVYFTSFSEKTFDKESLVTLVANMVTLAPQLTHGFEGARPGQPLPKHQLDAITEIRTVDDFDGYPDCWLTPGLELFDQKDMPLFRVRAVVRRDGPDAEGRASMIMVQSSHALMEGSDSALLTRSQNSSHGAMSNKKSRVSLKQRLTYAGIAALTAPIHITMANLLSPKKKEMCFKSLTFKRATLRRVANRLGVRQRSLMFGIVMHALNRGGEGLSPKEIRTTYTTLDSDRHDADDDFFRVRAINANFGVQDDLVDFIRGIDERIGEVESRDTTHMQFVLNATFRTHRFISRFLPFLYSRRFFRFDGGYHVVLTMVPPHRIYGNLTHGMSEPIYCGSYHPGSNLCTFVPGREFVTFNFSLRAEHLAQVDKVEGLLAGLDAA